MDRTILLTVGGKNIYGYEAGKVIAFESGLSVDADGSPHAYSPIPGQGLDFTDNAGHPGNWWALVTDNGSSNGNPVVQGPADPAPGFYISTTTLEDHSKNAKDPKRYVDSETIPFIALPSTLQKFNFKIGDIGYAYYKDHKILSPFIFADFGPGNHVGEGSIKLAENLGINDSPKKGGVSGNVVYLLFTGSGTGKVKTADEIQEIGDAFAKLFDIKAILADF